MAASKFDESFEKSKSEFKKKFNKDWDKEPSLFLQFVQLLYTSELYYFVSSGLNQVYGEQQSVSRKVAEIKTALQELSKK